MIRVLTLAAAGLAVAGCAPMAPPSAQDRAAAAVRPCFLPQTTVNFTADRDTTAYIRAGRNQVFELGSGGCPGLSAARSITLGSLPGQGATACVGDTVAVITAGLSPASGAGSPCRAQVVRMLTEAEVAELPGRLRP